MANAQHSNKSSEWYTPPEWIERVRTVLGGIDLDPTSSEEANETVRATRYYTKTLPGLRESEPWIGPNIFCNPPGSCGRSCCSKRCVCKLPQRFWDKLVETCIGNKTVSAIYLAYSLEQLLWMNVSAVEAIAIPHKRIKFVGAGSNPTHGNAFVLLTSNDDVLERFKQQFGPHCNLLYP